MSYAMCLDNSWDVMCEEEMYDVNGGGTATLYVTCTIGGFLSSAMISGACLLFVAKFTTIGAAMGGVLGMLIGLAAGGAVAAAINSALKQTTGLGTYKFAVLEKSGFLIPNGSYTLDLGSIAGGGAGGVTGVALASSGYLGYALAFAR